MTRRRRHLTRALLLVTLTLLVACGSVPRRYYYTLSYPLDEVTDRPALHPVRLRIKPFGVGLPYNRPQIVYRQTPYQYQYYTFRMWAAKPQHLVRELTERHIRAVGLVDEVTREYLEELPDYELEGEIIAMEEFDSGDIWYGHLAMRFRLVRFRDKMPLWTYHFDRTKRIYERDLVYVIRALSGILEEELGRITAELDVVLSRERGVEPSLTVPATAPSDTAPATAPGGADIIRPESEAPGPTVLPSDVIRPDDQPLPRVDPEEGP